MAFKKGDSKPEGSGKPKGYKERSAKMRDFLFDFFEEKIERGDLEDAWDRLNEREQWEVYIKCLKYMCPQEEEENDGKVTGFGQLIKNLARR